MAEQHDQQHHHHHVEEKSGEVPVETTDRGLFDFMAVKQKEECCEEIKTTHHVEEKDEVIGAEFEKLHVSEAEPKVEEHKDQEEKKGSLLEKFHRSDSASSSSSSDEEEGGEKKEKKKKKKGLKEKKEKEEKHEEDTSVPIEKCEEEAVAQPEEKKGFLDKIKEKLPGQHKKTEEAVVAPPPPVMVECYAAEESSQAGHEADQPKEKKGFLEKIKEKIPGYHPKSPTSSPSEEEKEKEKD
ncbi:phosphoprotein ECPP44 [Rhododendron vialii]|uniref:phosphoprotein ECPP44 n=1 Tax=Rhododendron vialii TaxID=182163 RepID=UPI00265E3DC1|nr:phosphoprotein ECPP44 [Rhododendron vialii]